MRRCRPLAIALGAAVLLGMLVVSASARTFALNNNTFRANFRRVVISGFFGNFNCQITLEGSFHGREIAKVRGSLIGYVTAAPLGPCVEGTGTILRETLPWHVRYRQFAGTLPNITSITVEIVRFSLDVGEAGGFLCLVSSTAERPLVVTLNRSTIARTLSSAEISGSIPDGCGHTVAIESERDPIRVLNSATLITVTLF